MMRPWLLTISCLYGMPFLLALIVHLLSSLFLGLEICCSVQSMNDRIRGKCLQLPLVCAAFWLICASFVELAPTFLRRLNLLYVHANVALVQVKQKKTSQCVDIVKTAATDQKHQKPVLYILFEMPACTYGSFPTVFSIGQPPDLMPAVYF
jgi:hypothetical protein